MRSEVAAVVVVAALFLGAALGYLLVLPRSGSTTTIVSTSTVTGTLETTIVSTVTVTTVETVSGPVAPITNIETGNTTLSGFPDQVAVNPVTRTVYLTDMFSNSLAVVNASSGRLIDNITLPASTTGIVVDSATNTIFVSVGDCTNVINTSNSCQSQTTATTQPAILTIDGNTNKIIRSVPIDASVKTVDSSRHVLYATQALIQRPGVGSTGSTGYLLALSEVSGTVIANVSLNAAPGAVALDPVTDMLYVTACQVAGLACGGGEVLVVNGTNYMVATSIPISTYWGVSGIVLDSSTNHAYLAALSNATWLISIDLRSNSVSSTMLVGSTCSGITLLGINPSRGELYAVASSTNSQANLFLVIGEGNGQIINMFSAPEQLVGFAPDLMDASLYLTIESLSPHQTMGFLITLSDNFWAGYVDTSLLESGVCVP